MGERARDASSGERRSERAGRGCRGERGGVEQTSDRTEGRESESAPNSKVTTTATQEQWNEGTKEGTDAFAHEERGVRNRQKKCLRDEKWRNEETGQRRQGRIAASTSRDHAENAG